MHIKRVKKDKCRWAFTMAEVLVVLGIVGILASATIPNWVAKYQKNVTVTKLKSTYTLLNQAYNMSVIANGEFENWETGDTIDVKDYVQKYWTPYLKVIKTCPEYYDCKYQKYNLWYCINYKCVHYWTPHENIRYGVVLYNGTYLELSRKGIIVDLNGPKGPNLFGRDTFHFRITPKGILPNGYDKSDTDIGTGCSKYNPTYSIYCVEKIRRDGWQIKDDYPWR